MSASLAGSLPVFFDNTLTFSPQRFYKQRKQGDSFSITLLLLLNFLSVCLDRCFSIRAEALQGPLQVALHDGIQALGHDGRVGLHVAADPLQRQPHEAVLVKVDDELLIFLFYRDVQPRTSGAVPL